MIGQRVSDASDLSTSRASSTLAIALAGMEADVRDAIGKRAMRSGANAAASEKDGIVFEGSS